MIHFDFESMLTRFQSQADWIGFRYYREKTNTVMIQNEQPQNNHTFVDQGVMIEVMVNGHIGHAATSDFSFEGLQAAFLKAKTLSTATTRFKIHRSTLDVRPPTRGSFVSPRKQALDTLSMGEVLDVLMGASRSLKVSEKIMARSAQAEIREVETRYVSSNGAAWDQSYNMVSTSFRATAQDSRDSQTRSDNGIMARCSQVGAEAFHNQQILQRCATVGDEVMQLLEAPNCPTEVTDLLLHPDQMYLQIHESIGHPLELDRILGDERNFAGWSFVKPEDFGELQYGSKLLNVVFDPTQSGEFASYSFDDVGAPATKEYLIQNGRLQRGLGSLESQQRSGLPGVASQRASSWNRAAIDRMANINIEAGETSFDEMIASVSKGLFMKSCRSWSIDDYRNKFQFGCEYALKIEDGRITTPVKNPNYRGQTLQFWNGLKAVGDSSTYETFGSSFCGKGEPSQLIRVGHAAPVCHFTNVEVFGGQT